MAEIQRTNIIYELDGVSLILTYIISRIHVKDGKQSNCESFGYHEIRIIRNMNILEYSFLKSALLHIMYFLNFIHE
jgi:hypothetical protein